MRVGWKRKRKINKGYSIYHFYFCISSYGWWSLYYKVRGNKRIRLERLIFWDISYGDISYYPFNLSENLMDGWIEVNEGRWKEIKEVIEKRDRIMQEKIEKELKMLKLDMDKF